jgi:dipeptidyl aminopeptidase/acylaminoacyl peptidase
VVSARSAGVAGALLIGLGTIEPCGAAWTASRPVADAELSDFIAIQTLGVGPVSISPDGERMLLPLCGYTNVAKPGATPAAECRLIERTRLTKRISTLIKTPGLEETMFSSWSPSGSNLALVAPTQGKGDGTAALSVRLGDGNVHILSEANPRYPAKWLDDQQILFVSPAPEAADTPKTTDDTDGIRIFSSPAKESSNFKRVAASGRLMIANAVTGQVRSISEVIRFDYAGSNYVALSPTRDRLVYGVWTAEPDMNNAVQTKFEVWLLNLKDGKVARIAKDVINLPSGFSASWSPDGRYVAWFSDTLTGTGELDVFDSRTKRLHRHETRESPGIDDPTPDVPWHMNAGGWTVASIWGLGGKPPLWIDNDRIVTAVYRGPIDARPIDKNPHEVWLLSVATNRARRLWGDKGQLILGLVPDFSGTRALQTQGRIVVHVSNERHDESWRLIDLRDGTAQEFGGTKAVTYYGQVGDELPRGSPDGEAIIAAMQSSTQPTDIWSLPLDGKRPAKIFELNLALANKSLGRSTIFEFKGPDGRDYHAGLILPSDYKAGCPVPTIVDVYYMNNRSALMNFFGLLEPRVSNALILSSHGYAVLAPDVNIASEGNRPKEITEYVNAAIDQAVRLGYADPSRLGVTGHSYGGYSTYSVITNSDRFKAAVVRSGFASWIPQYLTLHDNGTNDLQAEGVRGPGGTLWTNRAGYIRNSPLFEFDRVKTPTLIVHGTEDPLSDFNARAAYVALRRLDKPVSLALYQGEEHVQDLWSWNHQMDYGTRMLAWYGKYLGTPSSEPCQGSVTSK